MGFGAVAHETRPSMLVGTVGAVAGGDFCVAISEAEAQAAESAELDFWGARLVVLTEETVAQAKERGAAFVAFTIEDARADGLLDDEIDYVVRLPYSRIEESDARALGSLRPAVVAASINFPLSVSGVLEIRRLAALTMAPIGVMCPANVSVGEIHAMRDSGVAALVLIDGASDEDVARVKQAIIDLPERSTRRDEDPQPLIPTMSGGIPGGSQDD